MPALSGRLSKALPSEGLISRVWPQFAARARRNWQRLLSIPSEVAIRVLYAGLLANFFEPVGQDFSSARGKASVAGLGERSGAIVRALKQDGVTATSLDALGLASSPTMFRDAKVLSTKLAERSRSPSDGGRPILTASAEDLLASREIFQWGLNDPLLDLVEAYLGGPCAYDGLEYYYSKADGRETSTRIWHRDREDVRTLKIALYVNDVDEEGGPFQIVDPEFQRAVDSQLSWRYASVSDAKLQDMARRHDDTGKPTLRSLTGAAGTVFFVDTARCHHRGKPPTLRDRSAIYFSYFSRTPKHPYFCERSGLSRTQLIEIAEQLPERQRAAVLWRDTLPWSSRVIPRNRLTV